MLQSVIFMEPAEVATTAIDAASVYYLILPP